MSKAEKTKVLILFLSLILFLLFGYQPKIKQISKMERKISHLHTKINVTQNPGPSRAVIEYDQLFSHLSSELTVKKSDTHTKRLLLNFNYSELPSLLSHIEQVILKETIRVYLMTIDHRSKSLSLEIEHS